MKYTCFRVFGFCIDVVVVESEEAEEYGGAASEKTSQEVSNPPSHRVQYPIRDRCNCRANAWYTMFSFL